MINTVVNCMKKACIRNEFLGHIGGDDFSDVLVRLKKKAKQIEGNSIQTV